MVANSKVNFVKLEQKWQKRWEERKVFESRINNKKKKFYVLDMFPYPSGAGLHMGHAFVFTLGDVYARFKRMLGFNVLYPIGYDALGLPAENAAIKVGEHPIDYNKKTTANFMKQQKAMGWSYDWSRLVRTDDSEFYKWDQWIFLKMLEKGLAYKKEAAVNWCPSCKTVLANEQAQTGNCERCGTKVEIKTLNQWFLKITDYAEELLDKLDDLQWPDRAKTIQKNWIGKSYGTEIDFEIENPEDKISNVVIVHGANDSEESAFEGGRENTRHWFPWIRKELEKRKINFSNELYPKDWNPNYEEWKNIFEKNDINENTILVGHSLGCGFVSRWLSENKKKVKKVVLVAPYILDNKELPGLKEMVDFELIDIKKYCGDLQIFYSDNDSSFILKSVGYLKKKTNGNFKEFHGTGHFCKSDGFAKFPELLEEILSKQKFPVFTTRPDTIFGVTFMAISAQHPKLFDLVTKEQKKEVEKFLKKLKGVSEKQMEELEKEGVFTGSYAINPVTNEKVPIYAGNFVVADYGSGMVMAVPAHDQRDFLFAKKYEIPIKVVIDPIGREIEKPEKMSYAYVENGNLINSGEFNGLESSEAKEKITDYLIKKKIGRRKVQFKLRDWLISRQRYWGTPIPVVHCEKCGVVSVPEKDLPVELPKKVEFGKGNPLLTNEKWIKTKCPKCDGKALRETDTMDTFANSSWYMFRYTDPKNSKEIFDKKKVDYWAPIDQYIGGPEHITMHLIYTRFYTKFLRDIGLLNFDEPALKYFTQGIVHGSDGEKMSKSRGNVVEPLETIKKYGADTLRLYLLSNGSPENDFAWDDKGIENTFKFMKKIINYFDEVKISKKTDAKIDSKLNKIIKEVTIQIENFKYNLAIIKIRELFNSLPEECSKEVLEKSLKLLHPFCPHITEELFEKIGGRSFISLSEWPKVEENKINENFEKQEQAFEKLVGDIVNISKIVEAKGETKNKVYVYVMPNEIEFYSANEISKKVGKEVKIFAVNDKDKYDPNNISKKSKPGKPGIYFE